MATRKVLAQSAITATTLTDVYTVPGGGVTDAVISVVTVVNRTGSSVTYRLAVAIAGAADATKQYVVYDHTLAANGTDEWMRGATLATTDVIRAYCSATAISVNVFGQEN